MTEVIQVFSTIANDLRTLGLAAVVLVLFYELLASLFPRVFPNRIGVVGVLLVALGFGVLPALLAYVVGFAGG